MAYIVIFNLNSRTIPVEDPDRPLLFHLQKNRIDWMHACGGKGRCTTCRVIIMEGSENAGPPTAAEKRFSDMNLLASAERLSCQMTVAGNMTIRVPDSCKLPHVRYSDGD